MVEEGARELRHRGGVRQAGRGMSWVPHCLLVRRAGAGFELWVEIPPRARAPGGWVQPRGWGEHRGLWTHEVSERVAGHSCGPCPVVSWGVWGELGR